MLQLRSAPGASALCDGIRRRDFLTLGGSALAGLTLADLLRLRAAGAQAPAARHRGVIFVYLQGGPPHLDMYDLKPEAPVEYRGEFRPIPTNVPGLDVCELMPRHAEIADRLAVVRNMKFESQGHAPPELMTGTLRKDRPGIGSVVSRLRSDAGRLGALPPYVTLDKFAYPSFLGNAHRPFEAGEKLENLALVEGLTVDRLDDRSRLLSAFDALNRGLDDDRGAMASLDAFSRQALRMVSTDAARDAFDLQAEPEPVRAKYGPLTDLLLARRLVEAGVSVVELTIRCNDLKRKDTCRSDWDFHDENFAACRTMLPAYDQAVHALVTDLHERGLAEDVAVVIWGEMGRTPRINAKAGRDHWPQAGFVVLAGGGLRTGQVIGATDARAEAPIGVPYTPQNVLATIYQNVLGIDPGSTLPDRRGRPIPLLEDTGRIREVV